MPKSYHLEDLHVGMRARFQDLDEVYGAWIYFDDYDSQTGGNIICIAHDSYSDEAREAMKKTGNNLTVFHQDAAMAGDEVIVID